MYWENISAYLKKAVDECLHEGVADVDGVEDERQVIADNADTVPLCHRSKSNTNEKTLPVTGGCNEGSPACRLGGVLHVDGANDLFDFADH
jgi:hypothetical protein